MSSVPCMPSFPFHNYCPSSSFHDFWLVQWTYIQHSAICLSYSFPIHPTHSYKTEFPKVQKSLTGSTCSSTLNTILVISFSVTIFKRTLEGKTFAHCGKFEEVCFRKADCLLRKGSWMLQFSAVTKLCPRQGHSGQ